MSFFSMQLEEAIKGNSTVQEFKRQFEAMQAAILDLEHKVEQLEKKLKDK